MPLGWREKWSRSGAHTLTSGDVQLPLVVLDARHLRTGIGRYISGILSEFSTRLSEFRFRVISRTEDREALAQQFSRLQFITGNAPIYTIREQFEAPWAVKGADLLH